jgi:hypothetical protein
MSTTVVATAKPRHRHRVRALVGLLAVTAGMSGSALAVSAAGGLLRPTSAGAATPGSHAKLTPSGAKLQVGQTADVAYEVSTVSEVTSTLAITVSAVQKGSISDLKDFDLDAQSKEGVPFYVAADFRNVGTRPIEISGIFGDLNVYDKQGETIDSITLLGDFPKCQGTEPTTLAVGSQFTECDVYIAPARKPATSVVFDNYVDTPTNITETKVTWRVE